MKNLHYLIYSLMEGNNNQNSVALAWYLNGIKKKNYKNWSTLRQLIDFWQKCQWNLVKRREISAMVIKQLKWKKCKWEIKSWKDSQLY